MIDVKWGVITDVIEKDGLYSVGTIPDMQALHDWAYQYLCFVNSCGVVDWPMVERHKSQGDTTGKVEKIERDFVTLFESTLDYLGYADSWIHIGIHKDFEIEKL